MEGGCVRLHLWGAWYLLWQSRMMRRCRGFSRSELGLSAGCRTSYSGSRNHKLGVGYMASRIATCMNVWKQGLPVLQLRTMVMFHFQM